MQPAYFQKYSQKQYFDFMLSPRSVSSTSNLNVHNEQFKKTHMANYPRLHNYAQISCRQKQLKKHLKQNKQKDFGIWLNPRYAQNDFQIFPSPTLKRYDSNKLNDIGKFQKQLFRSKSVSQIKQKSRIQILTHIQKALQNENTQRNCHQHFTETDSPKLLFRQNLSNRINRLQEYLYKIKKQRQRQKVKTLGLITCKNRSQKLDQSIQKKPQHILSKQNIEQQKNLQEDRRISNIKILLQKLQQVKQEVFELKKQRLKQLIQQQKNHCPQYQSLQKHKNNPQIYNSQYTSSLNKLNGHQYPPALAKFKSSMQRHQTQYKPNQQTRIIQQNLGFSQIINPVQYPQTVNSLGYPQITNRVEYPQTANSFSLPRTVNNGLGYPNLASGQQTRQLILPYKKKINFTFGKISPQISNISSSSSKNFYST